MQTTNVHGPMDNAGVTSTAKVVPTPKMQKQQTATMADWEAQQARSQVGGKQKKKVGEYG